MFEQIQRLPFPLIEASPRTVNQDIRQLCSTGVVSICAGWTGRPTVLGASTPLRHKLLQKTRYFHAKILWVIRGRIAPPRTVAVGSVAYVMSSMRAQRSDGSRPTALAL